MKPFLCLLAVLLAGCATPKPDPIDHLVARLGAASGMWVNGLFPMISLPADAPVHEVLAKVFEMTGFDRGHAATWVILKVRDVRIPNSHPDAYTAVLVETNLGPKVVLLQAPANPNLGWWSRVYDAGG